MKRLSPARRFCALLFLFVSLFLLVASCSNSPKNPAEDGQGNTALPEGTGAELSGDALQFLNGNPWTEDAHLEKLPVYRNPFYETRDTLPKYFENDALYLEVQDVAKTLGMNITDYTYENFVSFRPHELPPEGEARQIYAQTDKAVIGITMRWTEVSFHTPQKLPTGFELKDETPPREEMLQLLAILAEEYSAFLGYEKPTPAIWTSFSFDGSANYAYIVYDGAGDISEQILGYNFDYAVFHIYGEGLWGFWKYHGPDRYEHLGDYEIISWQEAQEHLLDGTYNTPYTFVEELVGQTKSDEQTAHIELGNGYIAQPKNRVQEVQIAHVELVYRVQNEVAYAMPYYRFYVKVDASELDYVNTDSYYQWYYVPAVKDYEAHGFIAELTLIQW